MNRREFLKNALAVAALAPVTRFAAQAGTGKENGKDGRDLNQQVTRRRYKNTDMTLPLLGFGLMRLPEKDGKVDRATARMMVDRAMAAGCNYFDTAYMYHNGESEMFAAEALKKYPRDSYCLTTKMPTIMLKQEEDLERIFQEQLRRTQAGYFDFYLMHWLNADHWKIAEKLKLYDFMKKKQAEGKIRRIGFSYHGEPEVLEKIAKAYPWDVAQIQLNYLDWDLCRSREQYEVLTKLGIPVLVMEPLKGGTLAKLTPEAKAIFEKADPGASAASWGLRYVASLPNVLCVLSGMVRTRPDGGQPEDFFSIQAADQCGKKNDCRGSGCLPQVRRGSLYRLPLLCAMPGRSGYSAQSCNLQSGQGRRTGVLWKTDLRCHAGGTARCRLRQLRSLPEEVSAEDQHSGGTQKNSRHVPLIRQSPFPAPRSE